MQRLIWLLIPLAILIVPSTGWSCEPIVPLVHLLSASTLAGSAILTHSLFWLVAAVVVKCVAFVWFEKRLPWGKAALLMLIANIVSTVPGVALAVFTGSSIGGLVVALPLVFGLGWLVQRRTRRLPATRWAGRVGGGGAMIAFVGFWFLSVVLYAAAVEVLDERNQVSYWVLKFFFVTLVACSGIIISAVLEESVIAGLTQKSEGGLSFYTSVFRANYVTLGLVLFVAAIQILPRRLKSPDFITSWLEELWVANGHG